MPMEQKLKVLDSTNTPLAASAQYVGQWIPVSQFTNLALTGYSDVAATAQVVFSNDGVNVICYSNTLTINPAARPSSIVPVYGMWAKLNVINGATPQGATLCTLSGKVN